MPRKCIHLPEMSHLTPMPNAVIKNGHIETSRVFGTVPNDSLKPSQRVRLADFVNECDQLMFNVEHLLGACGASLGDLLKVNVEVAMSVDFGGLGGQDKRGAISNFRKEAKKELAIAWKKYFPDPMDSPVRNIAFVDDLSDGCRIAVTFVAQIDQPVSDMLNENPPSRLGD